MSTVNYDTKYVKVKYLSLKNTNFFLLQKRLFAFLIRLIGCFSSRVQYHICPAEDMLSLDWEKGCRVIYGSGQSPATQ